ncbi:MAG: Maf family nucleotide pyrophosphatase [Marinobacter sp.]|uniref:nucleoside triphosphate pyrophosphatase n=1 Tax=Marinobacter sp. TaxID=50741 RepID=UPI0034A0ABD7
MLDPQLVLASSSPYRKALMGQLGLKFVTASPDIDEARHPGESTPAMVTRLAEEKAKALARRFPHHWIIGSDQAAALPDGVQLSKPGNYTRALAQLRACSGQVVTFHTGLALLDSASERIETRCELFKVHFRSLTNQDIDQYLKIEKPYDCAGSFKVEGLGISLFSALEGRDPNALIGLPLIALTDLLIAWGMKPLAAAYRNSSRDSTI